MNVKVVYVFVVLCYCLVQSGVHAAAGAHCGGTGGHGFSFGGYTANGDITAIKVCFGNVIDSIKVRFGSRWTFRAGGGAGHCSTFDVPSGHRITGVDMVSKSFWFIRVLCSLTVHTNKGARHQFGSCGGHTCGGFRAPGGHAFKYITGKAAKYVDNLTWHY